MENTSPQSASVAIALGSNLGDRNSSIAAALRALEALPATRVDRISELFETEPVGPGVQGKYLNAAALLTTSLAPRVLLDYMLSIERALGRMREVGRQWGPRIIDLDLLLYGDRIIAEPGLIVPHPRMHERRFVLEPLARIAPDFVHPVRRETVAQLLTRVS